MLRRRILFFDCVIPVLAIQLQNAAKDLVTGL